MPIAYPRARRRRLSLALSLAFAGASAAAQAQSGLPTDGRVTAGTGSVSQTSATSLVVTQGSDKLAMTWQSFSIGAGHSVRFDQPSASSIALNRVIGNSRSEIYGNLSANGQVFLVNPNGVLFGAGAQVDVGGLVASTLNITDRDFLDGKYVLSDPSSRSTVLNEGSLNGRYVALIGHQAVNRGTIQAERGAVALGGGTAVELTLADNKLIKFQVTQSALDALAENGGLIRANAGHVILTAGARDSLLASTVNNSGVIEAQTVERQSGSILLLAGMEAGTAHVGGRLDASAPASLNPNGGEGGFIETSGAHVKVKDDARVTTKAANGKSGTWLIDPQDFTIGVDITGAALSSQLASGNVTIQSVTGGASGNGDIHVNQAVSWSANQLTLTAERDININAVMTATGSSSLVMNTGTTVAGGTVKVGLTPSGFTGRVDFDRSGTGFLTINGNAYTVINSLGAQGSTTGTDLQGMKGNLGGYYALGANIDASATSGWNGGQGFEPVGTPFTVFEGRFNGLGHTISNLTINRPGTDYVGLFGYTLSGGTTEIGNVGLNGSSVSGAGYVGGLVGYFEGGTIRNSYTASSVSGASTVGGLVGWSAGSTISDSHATGSVAAGVDGLAGGLAGASDGTTIRDSYATGSVTSTGGPYTGGLVGSQFGGSISGSHATGNVSGASIVGGLTGYGSTITDSYAVGAVTGSSDTVGGLVGLSIGTISNSYATGSVNGTVAVGGLVGQLSPGAGAIINSYATGSVNGTNVVGGLAGYNDFGTISNSYATGSVNGAGASVGGLIGGNGGTVTGSYWDVQTSGQPGSAAGIGLTTAQMRQLASFGGWDIAGTGGSSSMWRIYEGHTAPLLRSFLTPLTVTANNITKVYDGTSAGLTNVTYSTPAASGSSNLFGVATPYGAVTKNNVGVYAADLWSRQIDPASNQQGYDIVLVGGGLTVTPAPITVSGITASNKVYDGGTTATVSTAGAVLTGLVGGDAVTVSATGTFGDKNVANAKTVTLSSSYGGADLANYSITGQATTTANITPAPLTVSGLVADNKTYNGTAAATVNVTGAVYTGIVLGDAVTVSATGTFANKNVGNGKTVTLSSTYGGADAGNYTITDQATSSANITPAALTVSGITASNKTYDGGTTATVSTAGAVYTGLIGGDAVTVSATGAFGNKNVGNGKTVTLSSSYVGADVGNYTITDQASATANITPAALTVSGITASNKVYDGGTTATVSTAGAVLTGLVGGDAVTVSATGTFGDKNVANGKTVTLSSSYGGADLGNYSITGQATTTANITPAPLTVSGLVADNKVYDGGTTATVSTAGAVLTGLVGGDAVTVSATGTFGDKNVANGKTVTLSSSYGGADLGNYSITGQATTTANITAAPLTVSGLVADNKVYDGGTTATVNVTGAVYAGLIGSDAVTVSATGAFGNKNVGNGKTVTLSSTYGGADAGNYSISSQTTSSADITPAALTVSGLVANNKVYDGGTAATVSTAGAVYTGLIGGDAVTVSATGAFGDKNVGNGKTVTLSSSYVGADVGNYTITDQASATANITPAALTVTASNVTKTYGSTYSFAGTEFSATGLVGGDTIGSASLASAGTAAGATVAGGPYAITVSGASGGSFSASNYNITYAGGSLTVNRAPLTVTANGASKPYDGVAYSGGNGVTSTGFVNGENASVLGGSLVYGGSSQGATNAGSYAITPGGLSAANYAISYVDGTLVIAAPPAVVPAGLPGGAREAILLAQQQGPGAGPQVPVGTLPGFRLLAERTFGEANGQALFRIQGAGINLPRDVD